LHFVLIWLRLCVVFFHFCVHLCSSRQILARKSNVRTAIRNSAISKVATHYELNKPGTTPSQVRSIVKQLLDQQRYILPYVPAPTPRAETSAKSDAASADAAPADTTSVMPDDTSPNPQDNAGAKNAQKPTNVPKVTKVCDLVPHCALSESIGILEFHHHSSFPCSCHH
jgi:hypothetical protein